jgi:tetratricopeptide (TPR) repeat protein
MRRLDCVAVVALLGAVACSKATEESASTAKPAPSVAGPYDEVLRLIERGQTDAALAALQAAPPGAESLALQGAAWARRAETAPLPTPPPAPSPIPRGYVPLPAPDFKPEELQALALFEQALTADPGQALAHKGIADLLAPHAIRKVEAAKGAPKPQARKGKATPPPPPAAEGPDASPERVIREYRAAVQADPDSGAAVEALIQFADRTDNAAEGAWAFDELLKREREKPEPHVRYGDFLRARRDFDGAIGQYRQALIWKADDEATKAKIGEIYVTQAEEHLARQEWALADQRLRDAQKWIRDKSSPAGQKLQAAAAKLAQIRRPTGRI